jgi:hypothetical protein
MAPTLAPPSTLLRRWAVIRSKAAESRPYQKFLKFPDRSDLGIYHLDGKNFGQKIRDLKDQNTPPVEVLREF